MDWAKFFQDNSQSLFTLFGVFLGSLITLSITFINNRFQAKERENDRLEQRREAKIQVTEKRVEKDIEIILDAIGAEIEFTGLSIKKVLSYEDEQKLGSQLAIAARRKHSLAQGIIYSYNNFLGYWEIYDKSLNVLYENMNNTSLFPIDESDVWKNFLESAGNLQRVVRHELISIRDAD